MEKRVMLKGTTGDLAKKEYKRAFLIVGTATPPHELVLEYVEHYLEIPADERDVHVFGTMLVHQYAALVTYRYLRPQQRQAFCGVVDLHYEFPATEGVVFPASEEGLALVYEDDDHRIYEL